MAKSLSSTTGGAGSIPGWDPTGLEKKNKTKQKRSNTVTNPIKTVKMVHIKKSLKRNLRKIKIHWLTFLSAYLLPWGFPGGSDGKESA